MESLIVGQNPDLLQKLRGVCSNTNVGVDLATISRWAIGGKADCIIQPSSVDELSDVVSLLRSSKVPYVVIGATSNLLFSDEGLRVPCIQIAGALSRVTIQDRTVTAEAGTWVPGLSRTIMKAGLQGAEHICGIPGTLGGLICMNGGTQRKGIGSSLLDVTSIGREGQVLTRPVEECGIGYRRTIYQDNGEIIVSARLCFEKAPDKHMVRQEMLGILASRRHKFPQKLPNCGSVFKSNPAMYDEVGPPGAIIEKLGFKGTARAGAQISPLHANFIVNTGGARAADVLSLIHEIKKSVLLHTGHEMEVEARYVTVDGRIIAADAA